MATIKEVAKRAGVSVGTVSNVLNGKTKNEGIIERVEKAMAELSYRVDATARSMGATKSNLIGVVLPNALTAEYGALLNEIEKLLSERGYRILTQFSKNNPLLEQRCIESCLEYKVSGCILFSEGVPQVPESGDGEVPVVLISRGRAHDFAGDRVIFSNQKGLGQALDYFAAKKIRKVGLIVGPDLFYDESIQETYHLFYPDSDLVRMVEYRKESGFKAAFSLVTQNPELGGMIAGSYEIALGVKKALAIMGRRDICVVAIKQSNWTEDEGTFSGQISASVLEVAEDAVGKLLDAIERPALHEALTTCVEAKFERTKFLIEKNPKQPATVRLAMLDCPAAHSLEMLSTVYSRSTGITVQFTFLNYADLENLLYNAEPQELLEYDGYMIDVAWLDEIVQRGNIGNWGAFLKQRPDYFEGFLNGAIYDYGMIRDELYAIPFLSGAQFLYYQKDLLSNPVLRNQFERIYGVPLEVPDSWAKLNMVAEFFTRSFNPKSPVRYGLTAVRGENVFFAVSFLNCLLAYQCDMMDANGKITINQPNAVKAMKSFIRSFQYTSGREHHDWNEAVEEFMSGDSALMITFDSHATEINDVTRSKVAGNVGAASVPGGISVLGGWSLALNKTMPEQAREFVLWACDDQTAILASLLGGATLRKNFYERCDLESLYPWKNMIPDHYKHMYRRFGRSGSDHHGRQNYAFTEIIAAEANRAVNGEITAERALANMELEMRRLVGLR